MVVITFAKNLIYAEKMTTESNSSESHGADDILRLRKTEE
jgi:hypothetical protein